MRPCPLPCQYMRMQQYANARKTFMDALAKRPGHPLALDNLRQLTQFDGIVYNGDGTQGVEEGREAGREGGRQGRAEHVHCVHPWGAKGDLCLFSFRARCTGYCQRRLVPGAM
jgi:hypothetical protein